MKTVKVNESDFKVTEYGVKVTCPYCKKNQMWFFTMNKSIDKTDYCTVCGKEFAVKSQE